MSTIEDFENAPVGATATHPLSGSRALKVNDGDQYWITPWGSYLSDVEMGLCDYTLDSPAPATAREALDLAWELAHEVKEGQVIPEGARYLEFDGSVLEEYIARLNLRVTPTLAPGVRTFDPLPEPLPDWLDAPAVLAGFDGWSHDEREVFVPTGPHNHWTRVGSSLTSHWSDLRDVTPLYPKEKK